MVDRVSLLFIVRSPPAGSAFATERGKGHNRQDQQCDRNRPYAAELVRRSSWCGNELIDAAASR